MDILYLIPARAGSKGLPGKNIKLLNGKHLISYSIDFALANAKQSDEICISSDDEEVINIAKKQGVGVPFKRPAHLASDVSSTDDVLIHALDYYKNKGKKFDTIMLLQPTSPFRINVDFENVINEYDEFCDMVVTVKEAKENPYFTLFEDKGNGYLIKSKSSDFCRRQDCPKVYAYNGSIYLIRVSSLQKSKIHEFKKIRKVVMPQERSIDIDTMEDWILAEYLSEIKN